MSHLPLGAPRTSPWGEVQNAREIAPGVWLVDTAGHGGIKLSRERFAQMPKGLRATGFSGNGWYEEDCDLVLPCLVFEDVRKGLNLDLATVEGVCERWHPEALAEWRALQPGTV